MNLLITTLGTTWQIVPELLGITNPGQYDIFGGTEKIKAFRADNKIEPVDECWIVTTEGQRDLEKLRVWADCWGIKLRIYVCRGVNSFSSEDELKRMRSLTYRVVLHGREKSERIYLSLSGGRKTMSADMQDAGNLFGCDAMLHVVPSDKMPESMKDDNLTGPVPPEYNTAFVPLLVNGHVDTSLVVAGDNEPVKACDYPLPAGDDMVICFDEDKKLEAEIQERKSRSSRLYANFYSMISGPKDGRNRRDVFRKLYFLHPDILRKIQEYELGKDGKRDRRIIRSLPKTELHTHLGGVLSPAEIIEVAKTERGYIADKSNTDSVKFQQHIQKILSYENKPQGFEKLVFGKYLVEDNFFGIKIDPYQELGDWQGSKLLQTKSTIGKAVRLYAQKLVDDNVRYVELRCSPYNYTKLGLSVSDVLDSIMDGMDEFDDRLEYRLICIIGRQAEKDSIQENIQLLQEAYKKNTRFAEKLAGIDLAGNEAKGKPSELRESFMPLLKDCVHITIHAGETEDVESIWEAVYHLSADRIGHGLKLKDKPELLRHFVDRGIGVEMCPSSNDQIVGYRDKPGSYPLLDYLNEGLKVSLNTDDCGISRTSNTDEFLKAASLCPGLTLWDCIILIRNALSTAFCDSRTKTRLMHDFEDVMLDICEKEFAR